MKRLPSGPGRPVGAALVSPPAAHCREPVAQVRLGRLAQAPAQRGHQVEAPGLPHQGSGNVEPQPGGRSGRREGRY